MQANALTSKTVAALPFRAAASPAAPEGQQPTDGLALSHTAAPGIYSPQAGISSEKPSLEPTAETGQGRQAGLSSWMRGVGLAMVGVIGVGALAGCSQQPGTTTGVTQNSEAKEALSNTLNDLEKTMSEAKAGEGNVEAFTGQAIRAIADYSRATGQKGQALVNDLANVIREHPKVAVAVAVTTGAAIGIGLDRFGVTDQVGESLGDLGQWIKTHPWETAGIVAVTAVSAYLIYDNFIAPQANIPPKPTGEAAEAMEQTFSDLETQLQSHEGDPQAKAAEVNRTLTEKIKDYAAQTGRSADQVRQDVTAWAYDHPIVATSMVMAGGVATGVLLNQAGVPDTVAGWVGQAIDSSKDGMGEVGGFIKEHPVISGVVAAGVAAGAGYLIYQAVN